MECKTDGCYKTARKQRRFCSSCIMEKFKNDNPVKYAYFTLRNNAKRRKKVFTISFDYFKKFCKKHEYIQKRGVTKFGLHIDRIVEELGYIEGNIQVLENHLNVKKIRLFENGKHFVEITNRHELKKSVVIDDKDAPF